MYVSYSSSPRVNVISCRGCRYTVRCSRNTEGESECAKDLATEGESKMRKT